MFSLLHDHLDLPSRTGTGFANYQRSLLLRSYPKVDRDECTGADNLCVAAYVFSFKVGSLGRYFLMMHI
jgi:hypothetical protein